MTMVQSLGAALKLLTSTCCLVVHAQTANSGGSPTNNVPSTRLALAASNSFRMVLRPSIFELDFVALSIVEEAISEVILLSTDSSLVDININVNQMNWLSPLEEQGDGGGAELVDGTVLALGVGDTPTTVIRFFAVGTFLTTAPLEASGTGSLAAVKALDTIIETTFQRNSRNFIEMLQASGETLLQGINDDSVIPAKSNTQLGDTIDTTTAGNTNSLEDPESNDNDLKPIEWGLIMGLIAVGTIVAVFVWQNRSRRTNEVDNRRMQNQLISNTSRSHAPVTGDDDRSKQSRDLSATGGIESVKSHDSSKTSVVDNSTSHRQAVVPPVNTSHDLPSHVSSMFTSSEDHSFATDFSIPPSPSDVNTHQNSRQHRYSSKVRISVVETIPSDSQSLPPAFSKPMASASSVLTADDKSDCKSTSALSAALTSALASDFGINWFRKNAIATAMDATDSIVECKEEEDDSSNSSKDTTTGSSSGSSSDVFHVGTITTNIIANGSIVHGGDTVVSKTSSVVTDWMRTIQVVNSEEDGEFKSASGVTTKESSSEQSSEEENSTIEAPSVKDEVIEQVSLEHSMANSKGIMGIMTLEDHITMEV